MGNLLMDNLTKWSLEYPLSIDQVDLPELQQQDLRLDILRLDKIHPIISGNKWFKLKGYLRLAAASGSRHIITFGGAWSNHIIATAYAAKITGLEATGIIRGERPAHLSPTLRAAGEYGMDLSFISREEYRKKEDPAFVEALKARFPGSLVIPEGGAGEPGIEGCIDILRSVESAGYSHILCAVGTGTTFEGLSRAALPEQQVIGVAVLKGLQGQPAGIITDYHFGGYARHTGELISLMNRFYRTTGIPSDFVYTGKLFYGVLDMISKNLFPPRSRLLVIHSGGLQGNQSLSAQILDF